MTKHLVAVQNVAIGPYRTHLPRVFVTAIEGIAAAPAHCSRGSS
jgi:hypothetical protein